MIHFKNKEGKLIVVYDHDESISHKFATTLVQRGYDNVFMLSGGIRITQVTDVTPKSFIFKFKIQLKIVLRQNFQTA